VTEDLAEERLKILKAMNTITGKLSLKKFTQMVGLTQTQTLKHVQELAKTGFVKSVGQGYSITEKGKTALKMLNMVPKGMEFHFYTEIGRYTGLSAKSLKDFCELVKKIDATALEFHLYRRDFENWIKTVFNDEQLANEFTRIRESTPKGENLRNEILKATEPKYHKFEKILSQQE